FVPSCDVGNPLRSAIKHTLFSLQANLRHTHRDTATSVRGSLILAARVSLDAERAVCLTNKLDASPKLWHRCASFESGMLVPLTLLCTFLAPLEQHQ
ncbi:hypothetical protein WOLCODRAFT_28066, partial [Wolfiporia cocos MD-104 SS10]